MARLAEDAVLVVAFIGPSFLETACNSLIGREQFVVGSPLRPHRNHPSQLYSVHVRVIGSRAPLVDADFFPAILKISRLTFHLRLAFLCGLFHHLRKFARNSGTGTSWVRLQRNVTGVRRLREAITHCKGEA